MTPEEIKKKLAPWIEKRKPLLIVLFGSTITGLRSENSDIDLGILFSGDVDLVDVNHEISQALDSEYRIDLMYLNHADPIARVAACQGVLVYEDRPGRFLSFSSLAARQFMDEGQKFSKIRRALLKEYLEERSS